MPAASASTPAETERMRFIGAEYTGKKKGLSSKSPGLFFSESANGRLRVPSSGRFSVRARLRRPHRALVRLCHRAETLVDKLLQALTAVGFGRVDVALRVGRDAV